MNLPVDVAVLYVARGDAGGLERARQFADACARHPAGIAHETVFLAKAWSVPERMELGTVARAAGARVIDLPDDNFDWGAYARGAQLVLHPWLCLLNSHSQPTVSGWLATLCRAAETRGMGMVGASGSWESLIPDTPQGQTSLISRIRMALHVAVNFNYYRHFDRFPNAHLRSNAVVLRRSLLNTFFMQTRLPRTKKEAQIVESGRSGLSAFVQALGLDMAVVGRDGTLYAPPDWSSSATFRRASQHNLLVSDNRTRDYDAMATDAKRHHRKATWGACPGE